MLKCKIRKVVNSFGTTKYYNSKNQLHRDNDLPAIEFANGDKEYYKNGKLHRDNNLPAVEHVDGRKEYWINGIWNQG